MASDFRSTNVFKLRLIGKTEIEMFYAIVVQSNLHINSDS